jgi:hypothetical protein
MHEWNTRLEQEAQQGSVPRVAESAYAALQQVMYSGVAMTTPYCMYHSHVGGIWVVEIVKPIYHSYDRKSRELPHTTRSAAACVLVRVSLCTCDRCVCPCPCPCLCLCLGTSAMTPLEHWAFTCRQRGRRRRRYIFAPCNPCNPCNGNCTREDQRIRRRTSKYNWLLPRACKF